MVEEFNKELMLKNINYLIDSRNLKVGELENRAGVSVGYISRITKDENAKPGIDFIVNIAKELKISVDTLLGIDLAKIDDNTRFSIELINKLASDTKENKLEWIVEDKEELNNPYENEIHPSLFTEEFVTRYDKNQLMYNATDLFFPSRSYGIYTEIYDNCYNTKIDDNSTLYIMNINKAFSSVASDNAIEIWISINKKENIKNEFICSTFDANSELVKKIKELYKEVEVYIKNPRMDDEVKAILESYINKGEAENLDDINFDFESFNNDFDDIIF